MYLASVVVLLLAAGGTGPPDPSGPVPVTQAAEPQGLLEAATEHYRAERPAEAVRLYREYLANFPDRADVRFFLGAALLNLNQFEVALEQARRALELDETYSRAYTLIGRIHAARQDWVRAQQAYRTALRLDPQDRDTWYFLGRCYYQENRFEPALEAFQRALSLKAEFSRTYENLGLTYQALGQPEAAEKAYRRSVELAGKAAPGGSPRRPPANEYRPFFAYGVFLYQQGRTEESLALLRKAVEADPNAAEARFELGKALAQLGRFEDAARESEKALALVDECRFRYQLLRIYLQQGRTAEAEEQMNRVKNCEAR